MKRAIIILSMVVAVCIAGILSYRWDSETNHGYRWGYWGQFNTVSNAVAKLPGVTIVQSGCNADVSLEEFGFDIVTADGRRIHMWFSEDDPARKLTGEALSKALLEKIRNESTNEPAAATAQRHLI